MEILKKYNLLKEKVKIAEKKRSFLRDEKTWANLRELKKLKLAAKDTIENI